MEIDLTQRPSPLRFPSRFNPAAIELWFKSCHNLPKDNRSAWITAVDTFTALCDSSGLEPFSKTKDGNLAIRNYLHARRRKFIRFLNSTNLMQGLPIVRPIQRSVDLRGYGFTISVSCQVYIQDGAALVKRAQHFPLKQRFGLQRDHRQYTLQLDPGLRVFIYNDLVNAPNRWHIGYDLTCPINPSYAGMQHGKAAFILNYLWLPLAKQVRPNTNTIRYI